MTASPTYSAAQPLFRPRRELGRTGFKATVLGVGDVADSSVPIDALVDLARRAIDAGLNVIDTAPGYEAGLSEQIVGRALKARSRHMFVIDKLDHLTRPVEPQVDESLSRLGLSSVDLFVFHGVSDMEVWADIARPGGGMEQLARCIEGKKVRFRGISSHHPEVLKVAVQSGLCDVVMFAVGPHSDSRYVETILPMARERGVGTIGFKAFGAGKLLYDTSGYGSPLRSQSRGKAAVGRVDSKRVPMLPHLAVEECVRYTLTCDPDVALLGMSSPEEQDAAFRAATAFKPLAPEEMADIRRRAAEAVRFKGPCWWNPMP